MRRRYTQPIVKQVLSSGVQIPKRRAGVVETPARMVTVDLREMLGICDVQCVVREVAKLYLVAVKKNEALGTT